MIDKLTQVQRHFEELTIMLGDPAIVANREKFRVISQERAELEPVVACFVRWQKVSKDLDESKALLETEEDKDLRDLVVQDIAELTAKEEYLRRELRIALLPKDPNDQKNIFLELRAGTGGDESALFAEDLFNMYTRAAEARGWKVEIISASASSVGGFKECIARIEGYGAYSFFKYERGVHRVQRVPQTETQGRIHTSTVTVAVLPEAEDVEIKIDDKDLRIDVYRSSGPGGQSVNTTDSAVRVTHLPTGLVVTCQDEKSQHKNKAKALTVLRSRLLDAMQAQQDCERRDDRRSQIGSGERSEKIRTYNFPQSRLTDHRIGLTVYQLDTVLAGKLELIVDPLIEFFQSEALKNYSAV